MEKETLEEAAENYAQQNASGFLVEIKAKAFIFGAKYQSERMYSEEDMIEFAIWVYLEIGSSKNKERTNKELFDEWFEQIKK